MKVQNTDHIAFHPRPMAAFLGGIAVSVSAPLSLAAATVPSVLEEIVITASRYQQRVFDSLVSLSVINRAELQRSTEPALAEMMRDVSGVQVTDSVLSTPQRDREKHGIFYNWYIDNSWLKSVGFNTYHQVRNRHFYSYMETIWCQRSGFINPVLKLKPGPSVNYELGMRLRRGDLSLDSTAFYTESDDYIDHQSCSVEDSCIGSRDRKYVNIDESRAPA